MDKKKKMMLLDSAVTALFAEVIGSEFSNKKLEALLDEGAFVIGTEASICDNPAFLGSHSVLGEACADGRLEVRMFAAKTPHETIAAMFGVGKNPDKFGGFLSSVYGRRVNWCGCEMPRNMDELYVMFTNEFGDDPKAAAHWRVIEFYAKHAKPMASEETEGCWVPQAPWKRADYASVKAGLLERKTVRNAMSQNAITEPNFDLRSDVVVFLMKLVNTKSLSCKDAVEFFIEYMKAYLKALCDQHGADDVAFLDDLLQHPAEKVLAVLANLYGAAA